MEKILISGGRPLQGEVEIGGAKNAVLALLAGAILTKDTCRIENIPNISDVTIILHILHQLGADVRRVGKHAVEVNTRYFDSGEVPYELTKHCRASYYLLGALFGRFGHARVAMPGGCDFGVRPINLHIKGFEAMGATVSFEKNAIIEMRSADGPQGSPVFLEYSVGATINIMLAAARAYGVTVIENAAKEPHVVDLANFLNTCGADIRGAGTDVIKIHGVKELHGCEYSTIPDQIEAGTFMAAVAATNGRALIRSVTPKHLESISAKLTECGVHIEEYDDALLVDAPERLRRCKIKTMPHPGFPTDMQPPFGAMLCRADGTSIIAEGMFDNRFRYMEQLTHMGAQIKVDGKVAVIEGVEQLSGAQVKAYDLRAGAAMVIAGLAAQDVTEIENIEYIDRGYEDIVGKLRGLGAVVKRKEVAVFTSDTKLAG
ncbi:MAG: UDP-N-acetylglucosamine 1-carboxyvinyltransferase [Oscillospiraceae bacterium]|jgi:UDP-N-acetylglucosamine 1-carboxyvinyltransferase|nr:UDP-N-acetylglucosamine 1-carboxyvinyltransferase [Oscillospiraceae bacterium]